MLLHSCETSVSSRESVTRVSTVLVSPDMKNSICEAMLCSLLFFFIYSSKFLNFPVEISTIEALLCLTRGLFPVVEEEDELWDS